MAVATHTFFLFYGNRGQRGAIFIFVLVVALGLVTVTLYFAHSSSLEYHAEDNSVAGLEAAQACEGAQRYVCSLLNKQEKPGCLPDPTTYSNEAVPLGNAQFWLIGRGDSATPVTDRPTFGLIDEASKINLNSDPVSTSSQQTLFQGLPNMTADITAAILDWRDADDEVTTNGAESDTYQMLNPPYRAKNAPFESVEELRYVRGIDCTLLHGEDTNRNGMLDPNENDGDQTQPPDNQDGKLDSGFIDHFTIWSREPNTQDDGTTRVNVANMNTTATRRNLTEYLSSNFDQSRAQQIVQAVGTQRIGSTLEFYYRSKMTPTEFSEIEDGLTVSNAPFLLGRINANTASEAVLACIPGIGTENAPLLVSYRRGKASTDLESIAWVYEALNHNDDAAKQAGPYLTTRSYQFTADVVAVGHGGRGMHREMFVIDTSTGEARVVYRRDLGKLGWPLGRTIREEIAAENQKI